MNFVFTLFVLAMGACGNFGGCGACGATQPLPGGKLPADQTLEGGAQIRVTQQGFQKLTSILPGFLNQQFAGGFCVPRGSTGSPNSTFGTGAEWCYTNSGGCAPGCDVDVGINTLSTSVTSNSTLRVNLSTHVSSTLRVRGQVVGIGASCTLTINSPNLGGSFDIALGIRPDNGELDVRLAQINQFNLNLTFGGCGLISDIANLAGNIIDSVVGQFVIGLLVRPRWE